MDVPADPAPHPSPAPTPVGRDPEVVALVEVLRGLAAGGPGRVVAVTGPAGIGKTTVVDAALDQALDVEGTLRVRALSVRGTEGHPPWPFESVTALLLDLAAGGGDAAEAARRALSLATADTSPPGSRGPAIGVALHAALAGAARLAPLVVVVEDAQWLDADSGRALAFAGRRLGEEPVAVVVVHRGPLAGTVWAGTDAVAVGPLGPDEARTVLADAVDDVIAAPVADRLLRACGGNPLALHEVARALSPDERRGRAPLDDPLPLGPLLEKAALAPLQGRAEHDRAALFVVAAGAGAEPRAVLQAMAVLGVEPEALDRLERDGLVRHTEVRGLAVADPLLASAVQRAAGTATRRRAHAALAEALAGDPVAGPWHRSEAATGPDAAVAQSLDRAAGSALAGGGTGTAATLLERAAAHEPDVALRATRLLRAAGLAGQAGLGAVVDRLLADADRALADLAAPPPSAVVLRARVEAARHLDEGRPVSGLEVLRRAAAATAEGAPLDAADALLDAVPVALRVGRPDVAHDAATTAAATIAAGAPTVDAGLRRRLEVAGAASATALGRAAGADDLRALLARQSASAGPYLVECAALGLVWAERTDEAVAVLDAAERRFRADGAPGPLVVVRALQAFAALRASRFADAAVAAAEASSLADDTGQAAVRPFADAVGAVAHAARGDAAACRAAADRLLADAARSREGRWEVPARAALGLLALGDGRPEETAAELAPLVRSEPATPWLVMWEPDLGEALVRLGRRQEAVAVVERLERLDDLRPGRAVAAAARLRALLEEDADRAVEGLRQAAERYRAAGGWFGIGRARLNEGAVLRRARRRSEARRALEDAHRSFVAVGADGWARQALVELRATGGGGGLADPVTLTPQELQVASLVASGASNRDVAESLFISVRTVESHLGRVYRKLGVRSRAQLAARAADLALG